MTDVHFAKSESTGKIHVSFAIDPVTLLVPDKTLSNALDGLMAEIKQRAIEVIMGRIKHAF
jgi:hypothetical protein